MKSFDLSEVRHSVYFWPAVSLSGIAVFFFGWATLILERDWLGQAIWGAAAALMAMVLLVTAIRASHRTATQRRRLAAPTIPVR
jgi:FtsH-binding integral membrane protein